MKNYIKNFCIRGAMFAWSGPVITVIVWSILQSSGVISFLTVSQVTLGVITTILLAFIAAGITTIYQIDTIPISFAGLIHMAVLYIDYLGFYLINGWLRTDKIWIFSVIFAAGFVLIWMSIYISVKVKTDKLNKILKKE